MLHLVISTLCFFAACSSSVPPVPCAAAAGQHAPTCDDDQHLNLVQRSAIWSTTKETSDNNVVEQEELDQPPPLELAASIDAALLHRVVVEHTTSEACPMPFIDKALITFGNYIGELHTLGSTGFKGIAVNGNALMTPPGSGITVSVDGHSIVTGTVTGNVNWNGGLSTGQEDMNKYDKNDWIEWATTVKASDRVIIVDNTKTTKEICSDSEVPAPSARKIFVAIGRHTIVICSNHKMGDSIVAPMAEVDATKLNGHIDGFVVAGSFLHRDSSDQLHGGMITGAGFECSTEAPTEAPTGASTGAPTGAPTGPGITGDPHITNIRGEKFDVFKLGHFQLLRVPFESTSENANLTLLGRVEDVVGTSDPCEQSRYITSLLFGGSWIGDNKLKLSLENGVMVMALGSQVLNLTESSKEFPIGKMHLHRLTEDRLQLRAHNMSIGVTASGNHGGAHYFFNLDAPSLATMNYKVGGLLGDDDHAEVSAHPPGCLRKRHQHRTMAKQ